MQTMTDTYREAREAEARLLAEVDPADLNIENAEVTEDIAAVTDGVNASSSFHAVLNALPLTHKGILEPAFWRYYRQPWVPIFYDYDDSFNDLVSIEWGPRGGGKSISAVSKSIIDGQMRGIECISNVPFSWVAKDIQGYLYKIESIPFDQEKFAYGDPCFRYKRLLIDEGNYLADRLRSTSRKNLAMVDILQQARKFKMCVDFCTINWMWLDPRLTGSLLDILIECNDLYYRSYGRKHGMKKGHRIAWDIFDQSGKVSGKQLHPIASTTFNARLMWYTYNTEDFVDPVQARKNLNRDERTLEDQFGNTIKQSDWYNMIGSQLVSMAKAQPFWSSDDLWDSLGLDDPGLRIKAGRLMKSALNIDKKISGKLGRVTYDLSSLA